MPVRLSGFHQSNIGLQPQFKKIRNDVELLLLFPFSYHGSYTCARVKAGNASATCSHAFGESSLGNELDLYFPLQALTFELGVLPPHSWKSLS